MAPCDTKQLEVRHQGCEAFTEQSHETPVYDFSWVCLPYQIQASQAQRAQILSLNFQDLDPVGT